jgi:competence protein ComEC
VLRGRDVQVLGQRGGLGGVADRIRSSIATALSAGVSGERAAVLLGIVLGEDEGLSDDVRNDFRQSGLYHLLAVSGQNVALVAGGVLLVCWLFGIPRVVGQVGALTAIAAYVMAVGAQPSVVRAGVAGSLASLAWICARERDRWWSLLLGALVLLVWNPYNLLDPGFQLSFSAVAAIFVGVPRLMRVLDGYPIPRALAGTVAVSAACGLATAPILLVQFGVVPVYSIVSNALAAPIVAPLLGLGLAASVMHPLLPDAAAVLTWLDGWLAAYLVLCARIVASFPNASLPTRPALTVVVGVCAFAAAVRWLRHSPRVATAALVACAALVVAWKTAPIHHPAPPDGLRVTFLDVGQGDATLVQVPAGALLVDEGPPEARVDRQLELLGVKGLSMLVLTHPQRDHIGGAVDVIDSTDIGLVLDPRLSATGPEEREAMRAATRRRIPVVSARSGLEYAIGRLRIRVLWPDGPGLPSEDPNDHAIVLVLSYGTIDVLLAADAESNVLLPLHLPELDVVKVSHHGSEDDGLPRLLDRIRPRVAVISVGAENSYGHPTPETLDALAAMPGLAVYRTDRDGSITIESDGRTLTVAAAR